MARHRPHRLPLFEHERLTTPTNLRLKVGDFVELKHVDPSPENTRKGHFFCIHYIIEDATTEVVTLRGLILKRNHEAGDFLPKKLNEIYLLVNVCEDDVRSAYEQNLVTVKLEDVVQRRKVNVTNSQYPSHTFRDHGAFDCSTEERRRTASRCFELACRWTHISYYKHKKDMQESRPRLTVLRTMKEGEANTRNTIPDAVLAASHLHSGRDNRGVYTLFDSFCGIGGVSVGARQAGIKPTIAFDYDFAATSTYTLNQPNTLIFTESVSDMVQRTETMLNSDILHLSPLCQPFSRAHTQAGQNDESNQATLFSIHTLLSKLRPRVVTLEEAEWLVRHHKQWWTSVVHMFTDHGYSVTWKIPNFRDYGVSQNRERVILFAACPGTCLPEIPPPTHGSATGLRRYVTIADTLRDMSRYPEATHNETTGMYAPKVRSWPAYDANTFAPCITTGGSNGKKGRKGTYHPSGKRDFTIRELACLQGFPPDFEFAAGLTRGQCRTGIGNAVPPVFARCVFRAVREALEREDAREDAREDVMVGRL